MDDAVDGRRDLLVDPGGALVDIRRRAGLRWWVFRQRLGASGADARAAGGRRPPRSDFTAGLDARTSPLVDPPPPGSPGR